MALKLPKTVAEFLKNRPEEKFTAREIANWIFENYNEECQQMRERSTATVIPLDSDAAVIQQIIANIGAARLSIQRQNSAVKTTEGRPRKYYFTNASDKAEVERAESDTPNSTSTSGITIKEHNLYPILSEFLSSELGIHSKRIDEKRASNSHGAGGNKWLYPDLVGMENLSQDWHGEIKDCVQQYADKKTKLWSFEVKVLVNRSNIREVFFQAVSNSSWANFGYLVVNEIEGTNTLKEVRILSSLHGIGLIKLDAENPSESQIMIPAKERNEIDWDTANRLAEESKDFSNYIKSIRRFYQTGDIHPSDWKTDPNKN